ncbi:MAG: MarR family winged helix-turn-helix transcriptional regulator [Eubacterium sp.]|nr:MarR family winged helix-turn-helix transcriptional regulator [Eubacterium sp.]
MSLEGAFNNVYSKFKLHFYKEIFRKFKNREATLTTVETFCMEIIYALGEPTVAEFAEFASISSPNAAYKINKLVKKGYIEKIQSLTDRREYHLRVTQKYVDYYNISFNYVKSVADRLKEILTPDEQKSLLTILQKMSDELMPEIPDFRGGKPAPEGEA